MKGKAKIAGHRGSRQALRQGGKDETKAAGLSPQNARRAPTKRSKDQPYKGKAKMAALRG
jgi:hypothetical protein